MSFLSPKKLILFGAVTILLIAIPLTVYLVQKQQELKSRANPATSLSFNPTSKTTTVNQSVTFDVMIDPGTAPNNNLVSLAKLKILYDATKLEPSGNKWVANTTIFPTTLQDPVYNAGSISTIVSVGADPTKAIGGKVKVGSVTFKALAVTGSGTPAQISFDQESQALSIGSGDQFRENVLLNKGTASVTITESTGSPTPTPSTTGSPTPTPSTTGSPTPTPSTTAVPTGQGGPVNQAPTCTALALDRAASGTAPYSLTFTASGTDSDGTISKITFNFGDGEGGITPNTDTSQNIGTGTSQTGYGTATASATANHTYRTAGTFLATATLTDNGGAISNSSSCTQTITVTGGGEVVTPPSAVITPAPTLPPTGPGETIMGIGAIGIILTIIGGMLFLVL